MEAEVSLKLHPGGIPIKEQVKSSKFKLVKIWLMMASRAAQAQFLTNLGGFLFLIGKVVRFFIFLIFLLAVLGSSGELAGYTREQVIIFYLIFNFIEITSQFLFRGVYWFRRLIVSGDYVFDLLKPLPSFFRPIFGWTDILDFFTLIPLTAYLIWNYNNYFSFSGNTNLFLFLLMIVNSLIISFSFHLIISGVCVLTTEIDSLVLVYRDLSTMARFPTDIYQKEVQFMLTFFIPVIILITVPAKALMGLLSWQWVIGSFVIGAIFLIGSLRFWQYALSRYSGTGS